MLLLFTLLFLILSLGYGWLIGFFLRHWNALPLLPSLAPDSPMMPAVSVIIPARNESAHIGTLLQALQEQHYPKEKLQVIVIDDHSQDDTAAIARSFTGVMVTPLGERPPNAYKKRAIEKGVSLATGELILCTDADCLPPPTWVRSLAGAYTTQKARFVAAPVVLTHDQTWLGLLQALDFLVLQGITGAGIQSKKLYMANGANMGYPRGVFSEVGGYEGVDRLASGDDLFLLHKIQTRYPADVVYLRSHEAIVQTAAAPDWRSFFQQRIRWASKSAHYKNSTIKGILAWVWLYNCCFTMLLIAGWFDHYALLILGAGWILKTIIEWTFVSEVARFFKKEALLERFFLLQPLHIVYTVAAGLLGLWGRYEWKGRSVR